MNVRFLLALAWLAIGFAVPSIAQEQNAIDPEVRQQIEALLQTNLEAHNKHDAAAYAAQYTRYAVQVFGWEVSGVASSQFAIEKRAADQFASKLGELSTKILNVYKVGDDVCVTAKWSAAPYKGYTIFIIVRDDNEWKIRMEYSDSFGGSTEKTE